MKQFFAIPLALVAFAAEGIQSVPAQQKQDCTLIIHADGFHNDRGKAGAALFRSAQGWPEDASRSLRHDAYPIQNGVSEISFRDLSPGAYAVVLFHDENVNGKLDRNFLGIPTEGFGFANNPKIYLRPPSFHTASIDLRCPATEIVIHLVHLNRK